MYSPSGMFTFFIISPKPATTGKPYFHLPLRWNRNSFNDLASLVRLNRFQISLFCYNNSIMSRTLQQKIEMIYLYGQTNKNLHETVRLFNAEHPDRPVCRKYLRELIQKFNLTGSVNDKKRTGRRLQANEEIQVGVVGEFVVNPHTSIRAAATQMGFSNSTVHRILKRNKLHPYKAELHQKLNDDDPDRRLEFCEEMLYEIDGEPNLTFKICFSDEATFHLNGVINRHNCRYWSDSNPHWVVEDDTQNQEKVNVWAGLLADQVIGPFFIEGNLNHEIYLDMLRNQIVPRVFEIAANNDFLPVFQQDGAPPHYAVPVRNYLHEQFPERWIGRRGPIEWPARSPDLTPLDFFLWGFLKGLVFDGSTLENVNQLRQKIEQSFTFVTPDLIRSARESFENRLFFCQEVNGGHFEQLI